MKSLENAIKECYWYNRFIKSNGFKKFNIKENCCNATLFKYHHRIIINEQSNLQYEQFVIYWKEIDDFERICLFLNAGKIKGIGIRLLHNFRVEWQNHFNFNDQCFFLELGYFVIRCIDSYISYPNGNNFSGFDTLEWLNLNCMDESDD